MFNHSSIVFVLFSSSAHFDTGRLDSTPWLAPLKLDCYKQEKHLRPNKNLVLIRSHCCEAVVYIYVLCWNTSTAAFSAFKEVGCRLRENSYLCFWSLYLKPLGGTVQVISETTFHITVIFFFFSLPLLLVSVTYCLRTCNCKISSVNKILYFSYL